jgi:hypothetical protein
LFIAAPHLRFVTGWNPIERPIDLSMPEPPLQRSDVGVDMSHFAGPNLTPTHDMIGDLLRRLDLHGDVKPVNDMRCRLR